MAEGIFNFLNEDKDILCSSAGISIAPNSVASKHAISILKNKYNMDISNKKATQIDYNMVEEASLILTMTSSIKNFMQNTYDEFKNKIFTLKEFTGETTNLNILDPFGGDIVIYGICHNEIKTYIKRLINKLK